MARGQVITMDQAWRLADAWYADRLTAGWRRKAPEEAEAAFAAIGLTGPFWSLR